jgi:hypothetical protein
MRERFELTLTKPEYVVGLHALTGELVKQDTTGSRRIFERLGAIALIIFATTIFFPKAMTGLFFVIVGVMIAEWLMAHRWTKSVHGVSFDPAVYPSVIEFNDEGISDRSASRTRTWQWTAVRRLHDLDSAVVFELQGWDMIVLPERLWPTRQDRDHFVSDARTMLTAPDEAVVSRLAPSRLTADWFTTAAIAAFVDGFFVISLLLPAYTRRYGPLADQFGFAGGMLIVVLVSAALGYCAYRAVKAWLPKLHDKSPTAATITAQVLIWWFAAWYMGAYFRWW